jgi:formylglycine-generating enzyme required for sulfatase activity
LCAYLAKSKEVLDEQVVAHAVERLFTGEQGRQDNNLQFVRDMLSARSPDIKRVLKTYHLIRSGKRVVDDERSVAKAHLKLSGLVRSEKGILKVRNEIYNTVFNPQWILENSPRDWQKITLVSLSVPLGIALLVAASPFISNSLRGFFQVATPTPVIVTVEPTQVISTSTETMIIPTETTAPPTMTMTPSGSPTEVDSGGAVMVLVKAGEFQMGGVKGDLYAENHEKPSRAVYLDAYYIDKFEVTNALYKACVDDDVCSPPKFVYFFSDSPRRIYYGNPDYDQHPVVYVDWNMAKTYCEWRDARLPTEAEWEKAARGTDARIYPWEGMELACQIVNYRDCVNRTKQVGFYEGGKGPYGTYDMAGNVWEWVADWYSQTYYRNSLPTNPLGPDSGLGKVMRGGSWASDQDDLRTSERRRSPPNFYSLELGFRCAQNAAPEP